MVPSRQVLLAEVPFAQTGKVDRGELLALLPRSAAPDPG